MTLRSLCTMAAALAFSAPGSPVPAAPSNPVLFVTVTPNSVTTDGGSYGHFVGTVDNHQGKATNSPRGGDLYIVYPDGSTRNLTAECGYGTTPGQEITVREPNVHWSGTRAIFSMAVGGMGSNPAPTFYQLYEITGILQGQTAQITKLTQPADSNNIMPCYGSDDSIIFATDRPITGNPIHYPPLDEYESTPVVSGLWKMNADGSNLHVLDHCPSGDFTPFVDSFGRVIFVRWDHLKRDQQADQTIDQMVLGQTQQRFPVTFPSENSTSFAPFDYGDEYFPENGRLHPDVAGPNNPGAIPHPYWDQDYVPGMRKQDFNFFLPWMINQDGTDAEVLNHIGRHEFFTYVEKAWNNLPDYFRSGDVSIRSMTQMREDPTVPGRYYGIYGAEFGTHGAGKLQRFDAPPGANPDTAWQTFANVTPASASEWAGDVALSMFRDPMPMSDGSLWAACNGTTNFAAAGVPDPGAPNPYPMSSNYQFTIRKLVTNGEGRFEPGEELVPGGISKSVSYVTNRFFPPRTMTYSGRMWELFPVEVVPRTAPTPSVTPLPSIEETVMNEELGGPAGVAAFKQWLASENLALVIARDTTMRADKQQPFNLKVKWSGHQHAESGSTPTEIAYLQFFSGQYVRAMATNSTHTAVNPGRRVLPRYHDEPANPDPGAGAPEGTVKIASDGSAAAFVPARRAMTWQLTEEDGDAVVRERYWLTFQPGEVRTCTNCHGINTTDVFGNAKPTNQPQALREILQHWVSLTGGTADVKSWTLY